MTQNVITELETPTDLYQFKLPPDVSERWHDLLDWQDKGETLTPAERAEAEELVNLAERISLLRLRNERRDPKTTGYKGSIDG